MRTIIQIPEQDIERLAELCKRAGISRAEAIRRAVRMFLDRHASDHRDDSFGMWRDRKIDSLEYQRKLRKEW